MSINDNQLIYNNIVTIQDPKPLELGLPIITQIALHQYGVIAYEQYAAVVQFLVEPSPPLSDKILSVMERHSERKG